MSTAAAEVPAARAGGLCLITGASGFIGGRLAARMVAAGREVRCLARFRSDVSALAELGVPIVRGDLGDPVSLAAAVSGCRCVVHCAALVSDWATVQEIRAVNVEGTRNMIDAASSAGVDRFVHLSTTDVYGHRRSPDASVALDVATVTAARFANWYAQSKLEAEGIVRRARAERRLETVILRPATVYGPGSKEVIGEIARAIQAGHMLLVDGGRADAGLCYVENLLDAIVLVLEHADAPGGTFDITDGHAVSWRRFTGDLAAGMGCAPPRLSLPYPLAAAIAVALEHGYRLLRRATGLTTAPLLSRQAVQVLGRDQQFSNRRAREELGWAPRVSYADGLAATLEWLRASAKA